MTKEKNSSNETLEIELAKKILFSLLSTEPSTSKEISEDTQIDQESVEKLLSRLKQKGTITKSGNQFSLNPEKKHTISILSELERDQAKRDKFVKYHDNPLYEAKINHKEKFDIQTAEKEAGKFQFVRDISPHEQAYCFERKIYFVWKEGPRSEETYHTIDKVKENEVKTTTLAEFKQIIKNKLLEIADKYGQLKKLHNYVLETCYGNDNVLGWDKARFYDLGGDGEEINTIMKNMFSKGIQQFLRDYAKDLNIDLGMQTLNFQQSDVIPLYYNGLQQNDLLENEWNNSNDPIMLTHGTYSHTLPNIIQINGLAARNYYQSFGIKKYYGGEGQSTGSYTPDHVSFWYQENGDPKVIGGYGSQRAYDYPIMIGIAKENAEQLNLRLGSMDQHNELTVRNYVPMNLITHVFVPSFKIKEITELFEQNGINHLKVLPLRQ